MTVFINAAYDEMLRQKNIEYKNQVGSSRPSDSQSVGKQKTDCITYVIKVLAKAFTQDGNTTAVTAVRSRYEYGTVLAKYLVDQQKWTAYYWNPDVRYPSDGQAEHPSSYQLAVKTGRYYEIPITGYIINYRPNGPKTILDSSGLEWLRGVKLAYGIARGGTHCFLVSKGEIYEVHHTGIGDSLYEVTPLEQFAWLSGAILVPPGTRLMPGIPVG